MESSPVLYFHVSLYLTDFWLFFQERGFSPFVGINVESPRVQGMETRLKLLGIVTLVYAFLLELIFSEHHEVVETVLRLKCHRTGARCREALVPLYRLRWAISRLWNDSRPVLAPVLAPTPGTLLALATRRC